MDQKRTGPIFFTAAGLQVIKVCYMANAFLHNSKNSLGTDLTYLRQQFSLASQSDQLSVKLLSFHCTHVGLDFAYLITILRAVMLRMYSLALISGQKRSIRVPIWSGKLLFHIAIVAFHVRQSSEKTITSDHGAFQKPRGKTATPLATDAKT